MRMEQVLVFRTSDVGNLAFEIVASVDSNRMLRLRVDEPGTSPDRVTTPLSTSIFTAPNPSRAPKSFSTRERILASESDLASTSIADPGAGGDGAASSAACDDFAPAIATSRTSSMTSWRKRKDIPT
jgi:hypothetical protein